MVLPATGTSISFNQIRIELGIPSQTNFNLATASADGYVYLQHCLAPWPDSGSTPGTNPDSINEWWYYDHSAAATAYVNNLDYSAASCDDACTSAPYVACLWNIYDYSSVYYSDTTCRSPLTGYYVPPTNCSGGTKLGQTCYEFSNGTLSATSVCTTTTTTTTTETPATCGPNFGTCPGSEYCCDQGGGSYSCQELPCS